MNILRRRTYKNIYSVVGVYILATDGSLISANDWATANKTANAIYVNNGTNRVLMALTYITSNVTADVLGGNTYFTTESESYTDLDGISATELMSTTTATVNDYTFPNGKKGYIPSMGEWKLIFDNYTQVLTALNACGGDPIINQINYIYADFISSTWYSSAYIWVIYYSNTYNSLKFENVARGSTNPKLYIRPFLPFENI